MLLAAGLLLLAAFYTALVGVTGRLPPPKGSVFPSIGIRTAAVCHSTDTSRVGHLAAERSMLAGAAILVGEAALIVVRSPAVAIALPVGLLVWAVLITTGVQRANRVCDRLVRHAKGLDVRLRRDAP